MEIIHPISLKPHMLFAVSIFVISLLLPQGTSVSFKLNFSDPSTVNIKTIDLQHDAVYKSNDSISLTGAFNFSFGRATYNEPVVLWNEISGEVINFTTEFSFMIKNVSHNRSIADGFTFFLTPFPAKILPNTLVNGKYLGIFVNTTALSPPMNQILAVEFDTYPNTDIDPSGIGCHVGIDINTIVSTTYLPMNMTPQGGCVFVDSRMTARIQYDNGQKLLSLVLWSDNNPNKTFNLNASVDITKILPNSSAVGFSAGTGRYFEVHQILSWSFNSMEVKQDSSSSPLPNSLPPNSSPSSSSLSKDKRNKSGPIIGTIGGGIFLMLILGGIMMYCLKEKKSKQKRSNQHARETEVIGDDLIDYEFEKGRGVGDKAMPSMVATRVQLPNLAL